MWCWDDPANCHSCIKQHDGQHWSKQPNDHFLSYWVHTNKEVVQETFYASYKHIFIQCSHHTQKKGGGKLNALNFCSKLVEQIVEKYGAVVKSSGKLRGGRPSLEGNPFCLTERHFLTLIPPTNKKDKPTQHCIVCQKHEQWKESWYLRRQCNEPFCVVPYFQ